MNGLLGEWICHARSLRQGDPLSPFLLLLVIEVLSALVQWADAWGLLQSLGALGILHKALFYTDNVIMFIKPAE
jgi:hypothetical protein